MGESVFAYLDPGTGATLMQLALAGTAGIAAAAKMRFKRLRRDSTVSGEEADQQVAPAGLLQEDDGSQSSA